MKKIFALFISIVLIATLFMGCAKSPASNDLKSEYATEDYFADEDLSDSEAVSSRKLIKEISLEIETKDYDKYIESLRQSISSSGGYIESSSETNRTDFRSFNAVIRIPVKKTDDFTSAAANNATVKKRSENVKDVTEQYVDIEARINVYKAEEESLVAIMKQSQNVKDLLSVKEQLADVRAKIESYTAQLKSLENQTDYSTISIWVSEVAREVESEGYWNEIWNNILDGFKNLGRFLASLFSFILSAIPYLLIIGAVAIVIVVIIRKRKNKKANKK